MSKLFKKVIFDNIHGNITLTRVEDRIVETPYYQRLRWVKQLGFTFYIYSGATHTRFSHALGVLHVMDKLLKAIGRAVPEERLFDPKAYDEKKDFHQLMRLAAMLHDIGTFPFSHTLEIGYLAHWRKQCQNGKNPIQADHENLGSHVILNTDFEGGITRILKEEGVDPQELASVISGRSSNSLANQLLHSDVDADRMDYLLRDSHHTGIRYGQYDIDYLIRNATTAEVDGQEVLCFREDAISTVEYFLISRFYWYSQIIEDGTGYKFDLLAAKIYEYFLENNLAHSFEKLIDEVSQNPDRYFTFNDSYFMAKLHDYLSGKKHNPFVLHLAESLAYRRAPKQIKIAPIEPAIVRSFEHKQTLIAQVKESAQWLEEKIHEVDPKAWMIFDLPKRDVIFTKSRESLQRDLKGKNPLTARDPVKILTRDGEVKLLIDISTSLFPILSQYRNFIPRVYVSNETYDLLKKKKVLDQMKDRAKVKPAS